MCISAAGALLGAVARAALEKLMATTHYEFQSNFARRYYGEGKTEGKAEGKAETLLKLLQLRGFVVPEAEQSRVLACRDLDQLDAWVARVLTARDRRSPRRLNADRPNDSAAPVVACGTCRLWHLSPVAPVACGTQRRVGRPVLEATRLSWAASFALR